MHVSTRFFWLTPELIETWSETIEAHNGAERHLLFLYDMKVWKTCRSGRGKTACRMLNTIGEEDINLMQNAFFNGHYGFHVVK